MLVKARVGSGALTMNFGRVRPTGNEFHTKLALSNHASLT